MRLDPGETKNEEARMLFMNDELFQLLRTLQAKRAPDCPFIFHREGQRIKRFTKAWETACRKAGLWQLDEKKGRMAPTRIFHDFRKTAVRKMVRSGIPERVAMVISGHRTRSVFERYNIVSRKDLKEAVQTQEKYILKQNGYNLVTNDPEEALFGEAANV